MTRIQLTFSKYLITGNNREIKQRSAVSAPLRERPLGSPQDPLSLLDSKLLHLVNNVPVPALSAFR